MYDIDRLRMQANFKDKSHWVCPANFEPVVNNGLQEKYIGLHDVTLRDGEQTFGVAYSIDERVRIAQALDELGVDRIEAGMPIISEENRSGIRKLVDSLLGSLRK